MAFLLFIYVGVWLELSLTQRLGLARKEPPIPGLQVAVAMIFWKVLVVIVLSKSKIFKTTSILDTPNE